jgi:hypothetical protein
LFEFECIITMLNLRVRKKDTFWNQISLLLIIIIILFFNLEFEWLIAILN